MIDTSCRLSPSLSTRCLTIAGIGLGLFVIAMPALAEDSQGPWECSGYSGDAHTRCLAAFVEAQRDQIASLQGKVQAQQDTVNQLKAQMERQAQIPPPQAAPPTIVQTVPPVYGYPPLYGYGYPPIGFGVYIGRPWFYGPPYFYRPYFYGPRFYGRHWHR